LVSSQYQTASFFEIFVLKEDGKGRQHLIFPLNDTGTVLELELVNGDATVDTVEIILIIL